MEPNRVVYVAAAVVLPLIPILAAAYWGAYVLAATTHSDSSSIVRIYESAWQAEFFRPAARIEGLFTEKDVVPEARLDLD